MTATRIAVAGLGLAFLGPAEARAQETPYELNIHAGGFRYDIEDSDTDFLLGARFMLQYPSGWGWGGNFDWVNVDRIPFGGDDIEIDLYLYSFELDYTFPSTSRAKFFVGGGVGAATGRISDLPGPDDEESETNVLVPLAAGIKFGDRPVRPKWAIRGEIRDNIIFVDGGGPVFGGEDEAKNNFEFSGGVSFFF